MIILALIAVLGAAIAHHSMTEPEPDADTAVSISAEETPNPASEPTEEAQLDPSLDDEAPATMIE
ncbi:MAG TPA: hypothetical protein VFS39_02395 [Nitrospira sp.]|nr:hypothetical protein [Nitrospira sp.]